ncbi:hypothetical protein [Azospirillum sp. SYSU D00513]|uniref:hypothetical protein n=1 Tax=Azospirillum sp. SYSU D00513 TaxID=2812561 RepID=UPI001A970372|nr:hypothetical protein [Azospirillum sp. SYSU D00513]
MLLASVLPGSALAASVSAGQAEAKDVARSGNCTPTKVEVMRYTSGRTGETVFKVNCSEDKEAFVLVQCRSRTCTLMR